MVYLCSKVNGVCSIGPIIENGLWGHDSTVLYDARCVSILIFSPLSFERMFKLFSFGFKVLVISRTCFFGISSFYSKYSCIPLCMCHPLLYLCLLLQWLDSPIKGVHVNDVFVIWTRHVRSLGFVSIPHLGSLFL